MKFSRKRGVYMLGAITGDIVGSRFERNNIKSKEFEFLSYDCRPTDDSIMTLAIAKAILSCDDDYTELANKAIVNMQEFAQHYPDAGYGERFIKWINKTSPKPYKSYGNGAAMRVSACAFVAESLEDVKTLAKAVTEVTHNHPDGIKGAQATATAIFMALHGSSVFEIRNYINKNYYELNFTLDEIRSKYKFDVSCKGSVPEAIEAFLESTSFEDAIRNAISIGGDSDTIAAIAGSIAEAYYGIPTNIRNQVIKYLDEFQLDILNQFESKYGIIHEKKNILTESKAVAEIQKYQTQELTTLIDSTKTFPPALKRPGAKSFMIQELSVDVEELADQAKVIVSANQSLSSKDVASQLLGYVATHSKSRFIRKIACRMIKEEWWAKYD